MRQVLDATVGPMQNGVRLDRALSDLFSTYSRNFLANLLKEGHVLLNGAPATKPSTRVIEGQSIRIEVPDPAASSLASQDIPLVILHQDADFAVVEKPAGLVVHPAAGHADGTLVNALLFHVDDLSGIGGELRPGIVHRLDKDTSGVLIVAKNDETHRQLSSVWNSDAIRKEYLAIVYGTPEPHRGTIDAPIGRHPTDRKKMAVVPAGRRAVTDYELVERLRYVSLVRCRLRTGRTHQIRVHLKHLGHPIVGDPVYSGPQWRGIPDRRLQQIVSSLHRQALHAARITFPHPRSGEILTFESPLPEDLRNVLDALRGA